MPASGIKAYQLRELAAHNSSLSPKNRVSWEDQEQILIRAERKPDVIPQGPCAGRSTLSSDCETPPPR